MSEELSSPSARRVQAVLKEKGLTVQVQVLSDSTRTSVEAAAAVGCEVGQIAKSLIFRTKQTRRPILVIASGPNRVNEKKLAERLGEPIERADPEWVREITGFAIGGIPPVAHLTPVETLLDEDLWQYQQIWAAGGTPHSLFDLTPDQLAEITGGEKISVK